MFCRFCGKRILNDSVFCSYCGKETKQSSLKKARAWVITGKYRQARAIYDMLIIDDPSDINGYIGHLRVVSCNYTRFDGSYEYKNAWTDAKVYLSVPRAIDTVERLLGNNASNDSEYDDFVSRYKQYRAEQEIIRSRQEQQRRHKTEQNQTEIEKRQREALEAELQAGDKAADSDFRDAFQHYSRAVILAKELKTDLSKDFLNKFGRICMSAAAEARYNGNTMEYFGELAKTNDPAAQFYLGYIYMFGKSHAVYNYDGYSHTSFPETDQARNWFDKVLSNGSTEAIPFRAEARRLREKCTFGRNG